jgi:hypothetical protein
VRKPTKTSLAISLFFAATFAASACGGGDAASDCDDGAQNGDETDIDCGGSCGPCESGGVCAVADDCSSSDCNSGTCADVTCGDGRLQAGEDCDDGGESDGCNADCTAVVCGDGVMNASAGEECEEPGDAVTARCAPAACTLGAGLDGTFGDIWEPLAAPPGEVYLTALQSFHYSGGDYLYDFDLNLRYDIADDMWTSVAAAVPWTLSTYWANGAADDEAIYVARETKMHRFDLGLESWTVVAMSLPDGDGASGATIFDGEGNLWYHGSGSELVRFTPGSGSTTFPHDAFDTYETRMAYDPISNRIAFTGFQNDRFMLFDLDTLEFTEGSVSPGGAVRDNACQDGSGGIYTGSADFVTMWRYDIAADTWTQLPDPPTIHDNGSSCVVTQDGYLYYATAVGAMGAEFYRLPLGKK